MLQSLISSCDAQEKRLDELQPLLAQLETQLQAARAELKQVTRERDQLHQALAECQRSLAGDALVPIPTLRAKEWIRPSGYKRYKITAPCEQMQRKQKPGGGFIPRIDPKTQEQMQLWNDSRGTYEDQWETEPTGEGKKQTLYLDGEEICTLAEAEMAVVEAKLHKALNPHPPQEPNQ